MKRRHREKLIMYWIRAKKSVRLFFFISESFVTTAQIFVQLSTGSWTTNVSESLWVILGGVYALASLLYPVGWQKSGQLSNCCNALPFHNICTESLLLGTSVCIPASFHAKPGDYFRSLSYRHNYLPRSHWGLLRGRRKVQRRILDEGVRYFFGDVSRGWGGKMEKAHLPSV